MCPDAACSWQEAGKAGRKGRQHAGAAARAAGGRAAARIQRQVPRPAAHGRHRGRRLPGSPGATGAIPSSGLAHLTTCSLCSPHPKPCADLPRSLHEAWEAREKGFLHAVMLPSSCSSLSDACHHPLTRQLCPRPEQAEGSPGAAAAVTGTQSEAVRGLVRDARFQAFVLRSCLLALRAASEQQPLQAAAAGASLRASGQYLAHWTDCPMILHRGCSLISMSAPCPLGRHGRRGGQRCAQVPARRAAMGDLRCSPYCFLPAHSPVHKDSLILLCSIASQAPPVPFLHAACRRCI